MLLEVPISARNTIWSILIGLGTIVWYSLNKLQYGLLQQITVVAVIAILIKNYSWLYVLYKTLPRDLAAGRGFLGLNIMLYNWERKKITVAAVFQEIVAKQPNKVAFHFDGTPWTFQQLEDLSNQVAAFFKTQGLSRGDTVALFMETRPEFVAMWLGLSKVGLVAALVNTNLRKDVLIHSVTTANSKAIILGTELAEAVNEIKDADGIKVLPFYQYKDSTQLQSELFTSEAIDLRSGLKNMSTEPLLDEIKLNSPKDKLVYIYTSGTTGFPKAAVINNLRFMFMVIGVNKMLAVTDEDIIYNPLPLYHTAGGMLGVGQVLLIGATVVLRKKFSASNFWTDCVKYKCTVAQYIGEICRYLLSVPEKPEHSNHSVRLIFGNGLRPQIWEEVARRFKVRQIGEFYGATEGNSNLVNMDSMQGAVGFVPVYAGPLYPVTLIRCDEDTGEPIRNDEGRCIRCKVGEAGVLVGKINPSKPVNAFGGYADKKASEKKIVRDVFKKGDMFFNSGDILITDLLGYYYFKDRTGDTYRWRGENVATSEVEAVISNVVGLQDCVVYGVEIPQMEGKAGMAAIVDPEQKLNIDSLCEGIKKSLPAYARPLFVRVIPEMPMTGTYKLKKRDLQLEAFDITKVKDPMYYLDHTGKYVSLTPSLYDDINNGRVRL